MKNTTKRSDRAKLAPANNPNLGVALRDGTRVVNERCYCGAMRTEHAGIIGHGPCDANDCEKFTWREFITIEATR